MALQKVAILKTAEQIEKSIVTAILQGELPPGATLPNERDLAAELGVTRPTLRETLKQLAKEGWLKIRHGKPTVVADYWQEGGLGVLRTLAKYSEALSPDLVDYLLEVRAALLPPVARAAARRQPQALLAHLDQARHLADDAQSYVEFDWELQALLAKSSGNPVFTLMLNDFARAYASLARFYFQAPEQRRRSQSFYQELARALKEGRSVEPVVSRAMEESARLWREIWRPAQEAPDG